MPYIKVNKHEVYSHISNNLAWFNRLPNEAEAGRLRYLTCLEIGQRINAALEKENAVADPPYTKLAGSTLTAMVHDGVMEREYNDSLKRYRYRPVLPIDEKYKAI